jgi:phospholipid/cholesterol/gamma-HCH transport system ATP-binding protein
MDTSKTQPPAPPLLRLENVGKAFDSHVVLDHINLTVERGETVVLIGGSGSGKTTLARIIVGLDEPSEGRILLDGRDLLKMNERERAREHLRFAMVFQKYALLDSLTVYENVAFPLRERRMFREPEIHARVMDRLAALGVADAIKKRPAELSGGMAKRVGIARAMVMDPEILVYDEPTSGLDPVTSRLVDDLIEEVRAKLSVTSIVITHDMATAMRIADRVVLLHKGRLGIDGPPDTFFASADERVRPFASSSGVEPARLTRRPNRKSAADIRAQWTASQQQREADAEQQRQPSRVAQSFHLRAEVDF